MWKARRITEAVLDVLDQEVVLDDRARDAHGIAFLEGVQANGGRGHLARHHHHRDTVHVGGGDAGDRVRHARAGGDQGHADFAGGARIAVGRVYGRLFVAHQHVLDGVLLVERVVDVQDGAAGVAPDEPDVLGLQGLDEDFGAAQFGRAVAGRGGGLEFGLGDFHDQPL